MIRLSDALQLPDDAVTQTLAFLARRGAGKSYGAMKLAEGMLDAKAQVVGLDPVGVWYTLRVGADGKSAGYLNVVIFGGLHQDMPLEPNAGAFIADLIVDRGISAVLDVSQLRKHDRKRFATDFAEQFFHRKKQHRSPIHLFIEEAQVFVPQRALGDEARMLGAFEDIIKLGRNFGIGATLISQRPQAVNKDALNQTEALFALQTNGAQERKALENWIVEQGVSSKGLVDELPSLPIGTAFLWSPSWLRKLEKIKIGRRKTFDGSATPVAGAKPVEPKPLSPAEREKIASDMAATVERAKADDPKALRATIADLQKKLAAKGAADPEQVRTLTARVAELEARPPERVEVPVLHRADVDAFAEAAGRVAEIGDRIIRTLNAATLAANENAAQVAATARPATAARPERPAPTRTASAPRQALQRTAAASDVVVGKGERAILAVVAQYPDGVTREQLTVMTGYKRSSRDTYVQRLRSAEYADVEGALIFATQAGIEALGDDYEPLPTGDALRQHWLDRLPAGERQVLEVLLDAWPRAVDRAKIDDETGYKRSSRDTYLQRLRSRQLVEVVGGGVKASDNLFPAGGR